jgi:hypothetical protein
LGEDAGRGGLAEARGRGDISNDVAPPPPGRRLRAENRDPDIIEITQAVQLAGRILRPRGPEERYEDVLRKKIIVFADARYWRHKDYLQRFFEVQVLPQIQ